MVCSRRPAVSGSWFNLVMPVEAKAVFQTDVFHPTAVSPTLQTHLGLKILPKFVPRNDDEVDALLNCKLRVYDLHISHILQILQILTFECVSG